MKEISRDTAKHLAAWIILIMIFFNITGAFLLYNESIISFSLFGFSWGAKPISYLLFGFILEVILCFGASFLDKFRTIASLLSVLVLVLNIVILSQNFFL